MRLAIVAIGVVLLVGCQSRNVINVENICPFTPPPLTKPPHSLLIPPTPAKPSTAIVPVVADTPVSRTSTSGGSRCKINPYLITAPDYPRLGKLTDGGDTEAVNKKLYDHVIQLRQWISDYRKAVNDQYQRWVRECKV